MTAIAVCNHKGGVGKTITSIYLAAVAAAEYEEATFLWDADPQASSWSWAQRIEGFAPVVRRVTTAELAELDTEALAGREAHGDMIIDTPSGDVAEARAIVEAAVRVAGVVVVPSGPDGLDLHRVGDTQRLAAQHGKPAVVLLTQARLGTSATSAARVALDENYLVFSTPILLRQAIADSAVTGELDPRGLAWYRDVFSEIQQAFR